MKTYKRVGISAAILGVVVVVFAALLALLTPAQSADAAGYGVYPTVRIQPGAAGSTTYTTTTSQALASGRWLPYETVDWFVQLDVTTLQTVTVAYQASADGVNWATAVTLVNAAVADGVTTVRGNAVGAYYRVLLTSTGTTPFTPTIKIVLK